MTAELFVMSPAVLFGTTKDNPCSDSTEAEILYFTPPHTLVWFLCL